MKKIILAFSGGLDTSFCVPYLKEHGFDVISVTVDTGGFTKKELKEIAKKSKKLGVSNHYQIDGKKSMFTNIIAYIMQTHGLYQESYPNMCADRYIIAEEIVKIAKKENAFAIAHGSTAMGNDQVRFDLAVMNLAPDLNIITPIRDTGGNRKEEQVYLEKKGFIVSNLHKKYSVNQNILGITYSGSELDNIQEPDESMFLWTKLQKNKTDYISIEFIKGIPIALNDKKQDGVTILQQLNSLLGSYGYGRGYYTGDCIIGIKGHISFEAPGIFGLISAHKALQQLVLTKNQQEAGNTIFNLFTNLLYSGKYYDPVIEDIKKLIDNQQQNVTGTVTLKIKPHEVQTVSVKSPFSFVNTSLGTYAQKASWSAKDAEGFIKLYGLQEKILAAKKKYE